MTREMTPEEADDHWSEHGDMTPAEVAAREAERNEPRCVNAHDRCYEGGPCPYCERPA